MDEFDRGIDRAIAASRRSRGDRSRGDRRLKEDGPTMTRPLRSWALVLRANDSRLIEQCASEVIGYHDWPQDPEGPQCAVEVFHLDREVVRELVRPIVIPWPGVSIDEAARMCGVNRTTIHRWGKARRHRGTQARRGCGGTHPSASRQRRKSPSSAGDVRG